MCVHVLWLHCLNSANEVETTKHDNISESKSKQFTADAYIDIQVNPADH